MDAPQCGELEDSESVLDGGTTRWAASPATSGKAAEYVNSRPASMNAKRRRPDQTSKTRSRSARTLAIDPIRIYVVCKLEKVAARTLAAGSTTADENRANSTRRRQLEPLETYRGDAASF